MLAGVAPGAASDALRPLWSVTTGGPIKSSAAVGGGTVYVGSSDQHVYALDVATGATRWSYKTGGPVEASPLLHAGVLYAGSGDGVVYALDALTGALRWKYQTGDKILGGANLATLADGRERIVVGSYDYQLHGIDPKTGQRAFAVMTGNYVHPVPAVEGNRVVFGACDGVLRIIDATDGKSLGEVKVGSYMAGSVALEGKGRDLTVYLGHYGNEVVGIDVEAAAVFWTYKGGDFPYFSSPAIGLDRIVIGGRDRHVHALAKETGVSLWDFPTEGRVDGSPVIVDGRVVIGSTDGRLYLLRLRDGALLWSRDLGAAVSASPAVAAGRVYIGGEDGRMSAFEFASPAPLPQSP
jgi:outer membrane protein assembly factor BamB